MMFVLETNQLPEAVFEPYYKQESNLLYLLIVHGDAMLKCGWSIADEILAMINEYPILHPEMKALLDEYTRLFDNHTDNISQHLMYSTHANAIKSVYEQAMMEEDQMNCIDHSVAAFINQCHDIDALATTTINYYKLHKIRQMIEFNQNDMQSLKGAQGLARLRIHQELKSEQSKIAQLLGITILK